MGDRFIVSLRKYRHVISRLAIIFAMKTSRDITITGALWLGAALILRYLYVNKVPSIVVAIIIGLAFSGLRFLNEALGSNQESDVDAPAVVAAAASVGRLKGRISAFSRNLQKGLATREPVAIVKVVTLCIVTVVIAQRIPLPVLLLPAVTYVLALPTIWASGLGDTFQGCANRVKVGVVGAVVAILEPLGSGGK